MVNKVYKLNGMTTGKVSYRLPSLKEVIQADSVFKARNAKVLLTGDISNIKIEENVANYNLVKAAEFLQSGNLYYNELSRNKGSQGTTFRCICDVQQD